MPSTHEKQTLPALVSDDEGRSVWVQALWPSELRAGMMLSPRIGCTSLRLRQSSPGYFADWHVAGEAVLILVRRGVLRITLRDESARDFAAGDAFIAADRVPEGCAFDEALHGHRAAVVGDEALEAVHIKLDPGDLHSGR